MAKKKTTSQPDSDEKSRSLKAGEAFVKKMSNCSELKKAWKKVSARMLAVAHALSSEESIAERESSIADWETEFSEPFPRTVEEWSAFQIRIQMGSGRTFSDHASGDEMWGIIEGYLKGLKERGITSKVEDGPSKTSLSPHEQTIANRNERFYDQRIAGKTWKNILKNQGDECCGCKVGTSDGVRRGAEKHAEKIGKALPKGKGGRPKGS